jgi:hypothetical protein
MTSEESGLFTLLMDTLLPGQPGIKIRAFLAFNRDNPLATMENLQNLETLGIIVINDDILYPLETI